MLPLFIYVACPYSSDNFFEREKRYNAATEYSAHLVATGNHVFSPITHSHPMVAYAELPSDWDYWKSFDERMLQMCDVVHVIMLPGHKESVGVQAEIKIARSLGKPVEFIDLGNRIGA